MAKRHALGKIRPPVLEAAETAHLRAALGPLAQEYSDAQLKALHRDMEAMAELLLDLYLIRTQGKKANETQDPTGFDTLRGRSTMNKIPRP
jgi:hypothetical protein